MCGERVKDTQQSYGKKWCVAVELPSHPGCRWHMDSPNQSTHSSTHSEESQACTGSTSVGIYWESLKHPYAAQGQPHLQCDGRSGLFHPSVLFYRELRSHKSCVIEPKRRKFSSGIPDGSFWLFCTRTDHLCLKSNQVWGQRRSMDSINCNCTCEVNMSMISSPAF